MGGKLERGKNDLATVRPDLALEWHPTKNGALRPEDVCADGSYHAWWQVEVERYGRRFVLEWQAIVSNRTGGVGCPYTSVPPKRLLPGFNDLASTRPDLARLWHPEKNGALRPDQVFANAQRKFWWCHTVEKNGRFFLHEWEALPGSVHPGSCPICHGTKCLPGYNDLGTDAPELLAEWDWEQNIDCDPHHITPGSNRKVHWVCHACGHRWQAPPNNRANSGSGCPKCAFRYGTSFPEQALYFYLKQVFPDCINRDMTALDGTELDLYIPSIQTAVEYDGFWSHSSRKKRQLDRRKAKMCREKGILLIRIRETEDRQRRIRARHQIECMERPGHKQLPWVLIALSRELMEGGHLDRELDVDLERDRQEIYGSYLRAVGERSLASVAPELMEQWDWERNGALRPDAVCAGGNARIHWIHVAWKDGRPFVHRWTSPVSARTGQRQGCPICAGKRVLAGYNDLASAVPELVEQWDWERNGTLRPTAITSRSGKHIWWRHSISTERGESVHIWRATPASRLRGGGCPICDGKQILPGFNDLATTHPQLLTEWDWERNSKAPTEVSYGYDKYIWWCHTVQDPQGRQWLHRWQASPNSRTNHRSGCPYCANKKALAGYNDLATAFPELAAKWDPVRNAPLTAQDVTPASAKRVYWTDRKGPRKVCDRTKYLRRQAEGEP